MDRTILIKKGLESSRPGVIPEQGELIWTTDTEKLYMGDNVTAGGIDFISNAQGAYIPLTQRGAVEGVATLGTDQKVPLEQLKVINDTQTTANTTFSSQKITTLITSGVAYIGHWNASTNTPQLHTNVGINGHYYITNVAGTQDVGQGPTNFEVGDFVIYTDDDGTGGANGVWEKSINSNRVQEVNNQTGVVLLDADDIHMTGYVKPISSGAIGVLDTISIAIGKLEKEIEDAVAGGGDVNVQSDWDQSDINNDNYIKNKPITITNNQANEIAANTLKNSYPSADANKLSTITPGAEANVQSNWEATAGDAFILNKPPIVYDFADLEDTGAYALADADKVVAVNSTGDGLIYTSVELIGGGSTTWIGLSDTPGLLGSSTIGKGTRINDTGTALEYVDRKISTQDDVVITNIQIGEFLEWDGGTFVNKPQVDSSQLEKITENGKEGWRLLGRDPTFYGETGSGAVDLSYQQFNNGESFTPLGATGEGSYAEGYLTAATGRYSHAEGTGYQTSPDENNEFIVIASGMASHAEGYATTSSGDYGAHAEGSYSTASGRSSHSEGESTQAKGKNSHAEGDNTIALNTSSHAAGRYNIGISLDTIHETGIGANNNNRKNAFEIYTDGTLTAPECTNLAITNRGDKTLITKEYLVANAGGTDRTVEKIFGDGTTTFFTLTDVYEPGFETLVDVFVDGLLQLEGAQEDYVLSNGDAITFNSVPSNGSVIIIKILG